MVSNAGQALAPNGKTDGVPLLETIQWEFAGRSRNDRLDGVFLPRADLRWNGAGAVRQGEHCELGHEKRAVCWVFARDTRSTFSPIFPIGNCADQHSCQWENVKHYKQHGLASARLVHGLFRGRVENAVHK